jgi:MSHA pilin protein MshD
MSIRLPHQALGTSLIELIIFIVIVSVALAGVLSVLNVTVLHSADPIEPKQSLAVAEAMMEEILNKSFANPSGGYVASCPTTCDRSQMDDVSDYNAYDVTGVKGLTDATVISGLESYRVRVSVAAPAAAIGGVVVGNIKEITVRVTAPSGRDYTLTGYRFNY